MTERQRRFCQLYAACGNGAQAARDAGYSQRTARTIAAELLTKPDILSYIRDLQDMAADARICSIIQVKAVWSDILRDPDAKDADRIRAGEMLARAAGAFIHLKDDDGGTGVLHGQHNGEDVVIVLPDNGRDPEIRGKFATEAELEDYLEAQQWTSSR